jgi:hypothetical protein
MAGYVAGMDERSITPISLVGKLVTKCPLGRLQEIVI